MKKITPHTLLLVVVCLVLTTILATVSFILFIRRGDRHGSLAPVAERQDHSGMLPSAKPMSPAVSPISAFSSWRTYVHHELGITFRYPEAWRSFKLDKHANVVGYRTLQGTY